MKKITPSEYTDRIKHRNYTHLDDYTGAHASMRFRCSECHRVWSARSNKAIEGSTDCPKCRPAKISATLRAKNPNKIVADHGDWLEVDVSTPKNKGAIMSIDKDDWNKVVALNLGHVFSDKHRYTMYAKVWLNRNKKLRIHHVVMPDAKLIDHIDRNGLNNRKSNLRACTPEGNARNRRVKANNTTGVTGVSLLISGKYTASIRANGKQKHLGTFCDIESATLARKKAEIMYFGEFAP